MNSFRSTQSDLFFSSLLSPWESSCILDKTGQLLSIQPESLADLGTLPWSGQLALQYLKLGPGDAVLVNDPFSGGTLLSYMTLVYGMQGACEGLILVVRTGFRARLNLGAHVEEEGLRIPLTPLVQKNVWMEPILDAICSHPKAPEGLADRLRTLVSKMQALSDRIPSVKIDLAGFKKRNRARFLALLSDIPHGEVKVERRLSDGEILRLALQVKADRLAFDFSGTSPSKKLGLTDAATLGVCAGTFLGFFGGQVRLDGEALSHFDVMAPLGSWLNSKFPTPTFRGMTEGVHSVSHLIAQALSDLASQKPMAANPTSPTWMSLEFEDGTRFFDCIPTGIGAGQKADGETALHIWIRSPIVNSIEQIESRFPIEIETVSTRPQSGGRGENTGGDGITKVFKILAPAELHWIQSTTLPLGVLGGTHGLAGKITIADQEHSEAVGSIKIKAGTRVIVSTSGGGGYGKIRPPA